MFRALMFRLRGLAQRGKVARELDDELTFHLDMEIARRVSLGQTPEEAARTARLEFGGFEQTKEAVRDVRAFWLDVLWQDLRFAWRTFRRDKAFTVTAILTLAVGIGATASTFGIVDGILFRPLPYTDPDRVMMLMAKSPKDGTLAEGLKQEHLTALHRARSFEAVASYSAFITGSLTTTGAGPAERVTTADVSSDFLPVLGLRPVLGRNLTPEDGRGDRVALLTHALWQTRYGADSAIVGKTLTFQEGPVTIVGVLPADFWYPRTTAKNAPELLLALPIDWDKALAENEVHFLLARLRQGVSVAEAQAEADVLAARTNVAAWHGQKAGIHVTPLRHQMVFSLRENLVMVLAAVLMLLLIACTNVANLLLARGRARAAEFAVRTSLGAGRGRLVRQLLTETVLLATVGGALGLLVSYWTFSLLRARIPPEFLLVRDIAIDQRVLAFSAVVTLVTSLVFGLVPALGASGSSINAALRPGARLARRRSGLTRGTLLVVETAIAMVLLAGAGLLFNSLERLKQVDVGFDTHNVLTATTWLPPDRYPTPDRAMQFYDQATERLAATPGVTAVATADIVPLSSAMFGLPVRIAGRPDAERIDTFRVSAQYFDVLRIPRVGGRLFERGDEHGAASVAVVSESMARRYFGGTNAIGQRVVVWKDTPVQIVGIVADVRHGLRDSRTRARRVPQPTIYVPYDAAYRRAGARTFLLRVAPSAGNLAPAIKAQVASIDPALVTRPHALREFRDDALVAPSFYTLVLGVFATVGLLLAGIGVGGVAAHNVVRRTHEIGIRLALGASARRVVAQMTGQAIAPVIVGLVVGVAAATAFTRILTSLLFEVKPRDPATFLAVSLLLAGVAALASYLPARRASKVDPISVLRAE